MMRNVSLITKLLVWRSRNISDKNLIFILSVFIGIGVGFAAVLLKSLVHWIHIFVDFLVHDLPIYLKILSPIVGIFITVIFVKYINKRPVRHGIPSVLYSISKTNGIMRRHNLYSSIITSALTVGFGGSVGLEGPTVATGGAIGSNVGRFLHLNSKQIILLLGCASAGAMAAIFKAPITAIVFALEVLMLDLTMAAIVPLLISSATAALTSYFFQGQDVLYSFEVTDAFKFADLPYFILLGIFTGFVSVYFTRMYNFITEFFEKIKSDYNKLIYGSILLGLIIFIIPSLYGEGYSVINNALHGKYQYLFQNTLFINLQDSLLVMMLMFILIVLLKVVATSLTFASGGVGGVFAPVLFVGANTGVFFAKTLKYLGVELNESNFALAGMAGMLAGVIHAPLTAIFLIAEITGGYVLFMPLMIVATISYATIRIFESNSVYTIQLAKRGELITHHKDKAILMRMDVKDLIETDFNILDPNATLGDLIKVVTKAHRNIFPVVDQEKNFRGIVKLDDIRHIMFNRDLYDKTYVRDLMFMPQYTIQLGEPMEEVAQKFQSSGRFNIAVLDKGKYLGFVSRAKTFSSYRKMLKDFSEH